MVIVAAAVFPALVTWVYFIALAQSNPRLQRIAYAVGKSLQFALPVVWVVLVQRAPIRVDWLRLAGLPAGLAFGILVFVAVLVGYHFVLKPAGYLRKAADAIHEKIAQFRINTAGRYLAMGAFYSILHSFLEEYYWRWFVFGQLQQVTAVGAAIVVSAVGFTLHHVLVLGIYFGWFSPATIFFSLAVTVGGAFWAWLYFQSGSLYGPWMSHLLVDAVIFVVGYDLVRPRLA
jgi:membrane protease YdiL (CAAX protease family)